MAGENLPFLSPPAASSFCVARSKLPAYVVDEVRKDNLDAWDEVNPDEIRWHGFRTFAVDGSKITLPRKLLDQGFKNPLSGYCPEALISVLFRLTDRMICDLRLSKQKDECFEAFFHLHNLTSRDLVIYDRGYISYNLIIKHLDLELMGVFPVPNGGSFIETQDFWASDAIDAIVELNLSFPTKRKAKLACPHRYR